MDMQKSLDRVEDKLNKVDEKMDLLVRQHEGVFKDVEWLKGSLKIGATFIITGVIAAMGWLIQKILP